MADRSPVPEICQRNFIEHLVLNWDSLPPQQIYLRNFIEHLADQEKGFSIQAPAVNLLRSIYGEVNKEAHRFRGSGRPGAPTGYSRWVLQIAGSFRRSETAGSPPETGQKTTISFAALIPINSPVHGSFSSIIVL
ncbi:hypothetical protein AXF42_Ash003195 [Apostasia shenzhenica]|uniref:Uncharacterized protein n=1 Tax=Apostasia shenzhenica TaxID=1088818 RepID=A0A2I0BFG7_9ASPA|nr:hypothetical protein AXF42_Ash003195 [Apostasia shenzhenica]